MKFKSNIGHLPPPLGNCRRGFSLNLWRGWWLWWRVSPPFIIAVLRWFVEPAKTPNRGNIKYLSFKNDINYYTGNFFFFAVWEKLYRNWHQIYKTIKYHLSIILLYFKYRIIKLYRRWSNFLNAATLYLPILLEWLFFFKWIVVVDIFAFLSQIFCWTYSDL